MDDFTTAMLFGLVYGAIGLGFFLYGKRQGQAVPMLCGAGLGILPYFTTNPWILLLLGAILIVLPFKWRA